jgi:hypothetical protein
VRDKDERVLNPDASGPMHLKHDGWSGRSENSDRKASDDPNRWQESVTFSNEAIMFLQQTELNDFFILNS